MQAGWNDLAVVENQQIVGLQKVRKIRKGTMFYFPLIPVYYQHSGILPPLGRTAYDQLGRQVVVVIGKKRGHMGRLKVKG